MNLLIEANIVVMRYMAIQAEIEEELASIIKKAKKQVPSRLFLRAIGR